MTQRPPVSVVVPFAGSDAELERLLDAVGELALREDDEVIIADNRPGARPRLAPGRVEVIPAAGRRTPGFARNRGADMARGEWLAFIDADTIPDPNLLENLFDPLPAANTALLAGEIVDVAAGPSLAARYAVARRHLNQLTTLSRPSFPYAQTANCAVRARAFTAVGGFAEDARAGEDGDLCFRLRQQGWEIEYRPRATVDHVTRETVRASLAQLLRHGSGAAWLNRRYPGSLPAAGTAVLARRIARNARTAVRALRSGDREATAFALLDAAGAVAFELGRRLPNTRPLTTSVLASPGRGSPAVNGGSRRNMTTHAHLELRGAIEPGFDEVLTPDALEFVSALQREFGGTRRELLEARAERRRRLAAGESLDFLSSTAKVREGDWKVAPAPADMQQRWIEITGPTDRKLTINALNSGADGFMADFEDANAPTWRNMVEGHINLRDAIDRTITYDGSDGRHYELVEDPATLLVRPRGWHLPERHILVDGEPVAGAFMDFGLYFFHCARRLLEHGSGPYFYLPKMESHREARLWNDVFCFAQDALGIDRGTIKATVLIETLPAAFEMDEILYELRDHSAGLNAGRWDYIFSAIKCFPDRPEMVLPDRSAVTMTVPFMRAYADLLAATCHRRGAHAIGGMAALIPSRKDEEANAKALEGVRADKEREVGQGYDGSWVAHPDLVPTAREVFEKGLGGAPNQLEHQRDDISVTAEQLLDLASTPGEITEAGLRTDVNVGFQYISFWLGGRGAAAINSLMEDAATSEISRSQIWQWVRHGAQLEDGRTVTPELVRQVIDEETAKIRDEVGEETWQAGRPAETREIFERVALSEELIEFLTLPAYEYLK